MIDFQNANVQDPRSSVETAGTFDLDAELEMWFSGLGKVRLEFTGKTDVSYLNKLIAHYAL